MGSIDCLLFRQPCEHKNTEVRDEYFQKQNILAELCSERPVLVDQDDVNNQLLPERCKFYVNKTEENGFQLLPLSHFSLDGICMHEYRLGEYNGQGKERQTYSVSRIRFYNEVNMQYDVFIQAG